MSLGAQVANQVAGRRDFLKGAAAGLVGTGLAACAGREGFRSPRENPRIWDLHCHLTDNTARVRVQGDPTPEIMSAAERLGIERLIFLAIGPASASPAEVRQINDDYLRLLERWRDRAYCYVFLNPNHVEESLRELDRCVRDGPMVGVKLHASRRCHEPGMEPIIRRAAELKAVVFQHTWFKADGNGLGESTPRDLVDLARRFPDAPLICGHSGGDWELGIRSIRAFPNLYLDLGGFDATAGVVEMAVRELGADRVIYGSDVKWRAFGSQLAKVYGADVPEEAKRRIFGENLRRIMSPILKLKGNLR